jgi:hypothetical protein
MESQLHGDYTPVLRPHTKNFNLQSAPSIGVDNVQRNFGPMVQAVQTWRSTDRSNGYRRGGPWADA